jgi:hypothetical protein
VRVAWRAMSWTLMLRVAPHTCADAESVTEVTGLTDEGVRGITTQLGRKACTSLTLRASPEACTHTSLLNTAAMMVYPMPRCRRCRFLAACQRFGEEGCRALCDVLRDGTAPVLTSLSIAGCVSSL